MQTFLPYPDYAKSAQVLDYRRLGKQRVETKQIYLALTQSEYGWKNHPAVKMWRGFEPHLLAYGAAICHEWIRRGYKDTLSSFFGPLRFDLDIPPHFTQDFFLSHQSNLIRKDPAFYQPKFPNVPSDLPYVWPI